MNKECCVIWYEEEGLAFKIGTANNMHLLVSNRTSDLTEGVVDVYGQ